MTTTLEAVRWIPDADTEAGFAWHEPVPQVALAPDRSWRSTIAIPEPIECVAAASVDDRIALAWTEIEGLRDRLRELGSEADAADAHLEREGVRADVALTVAVAFRRFLAELREDAEEEALAIIEAARAEARMIARSADQPLDIVERRLASWRELVRRPAADATVVTLAWRSPATPDAPVVRVEGDELPVRVESFELFAPVAGPESELPAEDETFDVAPTDVLGPEGFWQELEAADARRVRRRRLFSGTLLLRSGAMVCVLAAIAVRVV
jgi:hypothetical protein